MTTEIRVPALGESVTEATVAKWLKNKGESVRADEPLVELETDKVTVEVPAPSSGVLSDIMVSPGSTIAARFVSSQTSSEQFCWNGVTGMMPTLN